MCVCVFTECGKCDSPQGSDQASATPRWGRGGGGGGVAGRGDGVLYPDQRLTPKYLVGNGRSMDALYFHG